MQSPPTPSTASESEDSRSMEEEDERPSAQEPIALELRPLARHCMPHVTVPWLVAEHVVAPYMAAPSMDAIGRQTEAAHRQAATDDDTDDHEVITTRNAMPVLMLRWMIAARLQPGSKRSTQHILERLCTLSHGKRSLKTLTALTKPTKSTKPTKNEFVLRPFLRDWCRLRLYSPTVPEMPEAQALMDSLILTSSEGATPFLATPVGRDEFFLRVARRLSSKQSEGQNIQHEAGVLLWWLNNSIAGHTNLDLFATVEFFDGFFVKLAWLHRNETLLSVIARSSTERCRALLTPAFRDAYFLGTIDQVQCETFHTMSALDTRRSALAALWQCKQLVDAAAAKDVRIPCTTALADFLISLTDQALASTDERPYDEETILVFEKILRSTSDLTALRTPVFRDSFFLKLADRFSTRETRLLRAPGHATLSQILAMVTHDTSRTDVQVFATKKVRDRLIVPLSRRLTEDARHEHTVEFKTAFTAAFNAIARTEEGSLKAVFDTEVVRSKVLPRLT